MHGSGQKVAVQKLWLNVSLEAFYWTQPMIAWMRLNITMNQLTEPRRIRTVDELSVGDQESDYDDDDRRELISHYATDKYLSKWELAEEDEEEQDEKWDNDPSSKEKWDNELPSRDDQE
ncbi:hypothetical protein OS493_037518 [Desmophyllum pertusum]|uniref:Uncharacterized protein n=1 Tax=Desmophyllum pertusum TaxID=174260 RepID=A0A9W9ZVX2_9CNID|nr:hypothetical protein OS493_037518 [Desmophyllum pertusum]